MCRHLAYLGPPVPLARFVLEAPHSLEHQAWAPRDARGPTVNADGYGLGWYAGGEVVRLRRNCPLWSDADLPALARTVRSSGILGAVRSATGGMPVSESACAPFAEGSWLFSHNGVIHGWPDSMASLVPELPASDLVSLDSPTDSAFLWILVRDRLRRGDKPEDAVAAVMHKVLAAAEGSRLNFLLTDGRVLVGTAQGHSLWQRRTSNSVALSSEPWDDDPLWTPVSEGTLVTLRSPVEREDPVEGVR